VDTVFRLVFGGWEVGLISDSTGTSFHDPVGFLIAEFVASGVGFSNLYIFPLVALTG
jgi:hypothetical protein